MTEPVLWSYTKQMNDFFRVEVPTPTKADPEHKRVVCFPMNEPDAKLIVTAVNAYNAALERKRKAAEQEKKDNAPQAKAASK